MIGKKTLFLLVFLVASASSVQNQRSSPRPLRLVDSVEEGTVFVDLEETPADRVAEQKRDQQQSLERAKARLLTSREETLTLEQKRRDLQALDQVEDEEKKEALAAAQDERMLRDWRRKQVDGVVNRQQSYNFTAVKSQVCKSTLFLFSFVLLA